MSFKILTKRSYTANMDRILKQMLQLMEEGGDSFAQKAEMYYQKRPELISLIEEFYHGYRSLAERYDLVTGELSQATENNSEPSSTWPSPSPIKFGRRISSNRAAGFEVFLGSGGNGSDGCQKDGDGSSNLSESDEDSDNESDEDSGFFVRGGEEERKLNEKVRVSEEEIIKLKNEIERYNSKGVDGIVKEKLEISEKEIASLKSEAIKSSESIGQLQEQLDLALKDIGDWKTKYNSEKRESTKLQEKLERFKNSLLDRNNEMREMKSVVSDAEKKLFSEKAQLKSEMSKLLEEQTHLEEEIRKIQSEKTNMEETLKNEIELLKEDIKERNNNIKDLNVSIDALKSEIESHYAEVGSLKEEVISKNNKIQYLEKHLHQLHKKHAQQKEKAQRHLRELKSVAKQLYEENEWQRAEIKRGAEEKREAIRQLCFSLEHYRHGYNELRQAYLGNKRYQVLAS